MNPTDKVTLVEEMTIFLDIELVVNDTLSLDSSKSPTLDSGCAHVVLSPITKSKYPNIHLVAMDSSPGMLELGKNREAA